MSYYKHKIKFFRNATEDINLVVRPDEPLTEDDLRNELETVLRVAKYAIIWGTKKSFGNATEATIGSLKKARRRWEAEPAFAKFFGIAPRNKKGFKAMERRFQKLNNRLSRGLHVRVRPLRSGRTGRCERAERTSYVSRLAGGLSLNVCPKFFLVRVIDGLERQSGIVVHEMAHKLGLAGKTHKQSFGGRLDEFLEGAEKFASVEPNKARRNPESFSAFVVFVIRERQLST